MPRSIRLRYKFGKAVERTNADGTCLWCGSRLRRKTFSVENREETGDGYRMRQAKKRTPSAYLGDYEDDAFCGLRCGYMFGVTTAALGNRLKPRNDE